jgi:hypothetical protein
LSGICHVIHGGPVNPRSLFMSPCSQDARRSPAEQV